MKPSFFTRYSLLILMVLTFSLPFIGMGTRRALQSNRNDVKEWLPDGFQETLEHAWFEDHFPHEQFILASWEGCTLDDGRLEMMARKLEPPKEESLAPDEKQPKQYFKSVLTGQRLIHELQTRYPQLTREEILQRLEGSLIGKDHEKTCLVVTLADTYHGEELAAVLQRVRDVATEECAVPAASLHLGGPPVDNAAIDFEGKRTLMRLAGWSGLIGLGVSWLLLRSVRLTLMVFFTAVLAAGIGLAIVHFTGGTVDAILLSMPSLVYVLAMSGAIHIINYYHDAVHEHGLNRASERALAHAWRPCFYAALTTALGLVSLCYSNLLPIRNFGVYSAVGVMATLVLLFLGLPAALYLWPSRQFAAEAAVARERGIAKEPSRLLGAWRVVGGYVIGRNRLVALACTGWMIFFGIGAVTRTETSIKLMKLFSPQAKILADYAWLEHHLGPLVPMEVVIRLDNDKCKMNFIQRERLARDVELAVEQLEAVGGALSVATFSPDPGATTFGRGYSLEDSVTSKRMERHRGEFREYLSVDQQTNEELWRVSARVDALSDLDYGAFVGDLKDVVEPVLKVYRDNGVEGVEVTYTGLVPLIYKAQRELLWGLFTSLIMAFFMIAGVMMFVLRSFSAGLLAMIPNVFPVTVIFGTMGWLGILVDVGSMMTASVALGVAVDDTIHYLTWFRDGLDQGLNRKGAAMAAYERCATAMSQTTLISGLGLAVFAFSTFTPTQRFGYLMLTLLFAALFGDLIYLPSLLTGPLGRFFDRGRVKRQKDLPPGGLHPLGGDVSTSRKPTEPDVDFRAATVPLRRDAPHRSTKISFYKVALNLVAHFVHRGAPRRPSEAP